MCFAPEVADQEAAVVLFADEAARRGRARLFGDGVQPLGAALGRSDRVDEGPFRPVAPGPRRGQAGLGGRLQVGVRKGRERRGGEARPTGARSPIVLPRPMCARSAILGSDLIQMAGELVVWGVRHPKSVY